MLPLDANPNQSSPTARDQSSFNIVLAQTPVLRVRLDLLHTNHAPAVVSTMTVRTLAAMFPASGSPRPYRSIIFSWPILIHSSLRSIKRGHDAFEHRKSLRQSFSTLFLSDGAESPYSSRTHLRIHRGEEQLPARLLDSQAFHHHDCIRNQGDLHCF